MLNKKADAGIIAVILVVVIIVFIVGIVAVGHRECSRDSDCSEYSYCGADQCCHQFEIKETRITEKASTKPYWILAVIMVAGSLALKLTREP